MPRCTPRSTACSSSARERIDHPANMVSLWMIGHEDEPWKSAEICIFEIFGRDVHADAAAIGMGLHPFGDRSIVDEFSAKKVAIGARDFHTDAAE